MRKAETRTTLKFETNGFYERIIALRKTQPKTFEGLSPATKLALAQYEQQKRRFEQDQLAA